MANAALNLGLVDMLLKAVREVVGCSVDFFSATVEVGEVVHVDVMDRAFSGTVPAAKLAAHICRHLAAQSGLILTEAARCASEGGTVTLRLSLSDDGGLFFEIGF